MLASAATISGGMARMAAGCAVRVLATAVIA
jgi:hypothetical protein